MLGEPPRCMWTALAPSTTAPPDPEQPRRRVGSLSTTGAIADASERTVGHVGADGGIYTGLPDLESSTPRVASTIPVVDDDTLLGGAAPPHPRAHSVQLRTRQCRLARSFSEGVWQRVRLARLSVC